ncbi:UDP-N-acetylmuramoyl-tripeptide--D-alanyl-D-alanine ligase [Sphingobium nicotianae]|uniref:UDP-N-acetylmuramoyl-tripeptide--D-alanyl-D-alanine ligase n=1 Tax=Sphingobium nicotianae TaxID=2782607 RepID=A0A9X1DDP6_9SPHN|nr:UDP-N-acetylmuramoyl-tripeptide--D-alanyl-D-alanine ligase [Sphingobium nicotianae]MBT2188015.1 UDP-N-acetylmuramoyl-tripeptide--D-alanyl-D-alanine ligase [Sphingobium nicotianae]
MSALWTSEDIAEATGGAASRPFEVNGVAFDSREVTPGDLFIALKGETADGHDYIPRALAAGAGGLLVDHDVNGPFVKVADTAKGLDRLGIAARARTDARIIGVTGSAGKTGTKEALYRAFERMSFGAAHRSLKSYNNHVGVPLSLARMPRQTQYGVFEMGMNHAGELRALTRMVRPHVAIVTTIAPAHIEYFGSEEKIAEAKAEIFEGLTRDGVAIIPYDSPHAALLYSHATRYAHRVVTFGVGEGADVRVIEEMPSERGGTLVTAQLRHARLSFTVAMAGRHWVSNALAVLAAVEAVGGDLAQAGLALAEMTGLPGRGARRKLRTADGGEALLIDEAYNANPASMRATLAQLGEEKAGRRIAVLGAMKELGHLSESLHGGLADAVRAANVGLAVLVGDEMAPLADALAGQVPVERVKDVTDVLDMVPDRLADGDVVLVKGSNSVGLSRLVEKLAANEVA